jgi:hypothetical protein
MAVGRHTSPCHQRVKRWCTGFPYKSNVMLTVSRVTSSGASVTGRGVSGLGSPVGEGSRGTRIAWHLGVGPCLSMAREEGAPERL